MRVHNHDKPRRRPFHGKGKTPRKKALDVVRRFQEETMFSRPAAPNRQDKDGGPKE